METLQKTTLSPTKFKYPFWMKTIRNLFYIGIGFAFLFLAWYILFDTDLSIIKLITGFSIILSLYFYFRILRLLPNSESSSRVQIKRALSLDIAQLFLFFVGIFGLFFIMGEPGNEEGFIMGHIFRTVISTFWLILCLIYFSFSKSVKEYYILS